MLVIVVAVAGEHPSLAFAAGERSGWTVDETVADVTVGCYLPSWWITRSF